MRYKDIVSFNEELFFDGSVEIDCIYKNKVMAELAAGSYVFHSKDSFTDNNDGKLDTITFLKTILDYSYSDNHTNPFFTAIAGYGSGKSHYCTAIAALFANNEKFLQYKNVRSNIKQLDENYEKELQNKLTKPNIVLALNGMNDFDLSNKMYEQLNKYLEISGINTSLFTNIDLIYDKAVVFVKTLYDSIPFQNELNQYIKKNKLDKKNFSIEYLITNIKDTNVFSLVNTISDKITGNIYKISNFVNPKLILDEICNELCGDGKPFDKVLIIFDEIGRYIEWLGDEDTLKDPSTMQQLYEGVKNSGGKVTFLSFIQFPLSTYFSHLAPAKYASIARYVDRYKTARSFHLSTILESVFSNLVNVKEHDQFKDFSVIQKNLFNWQDDFQKNILWYDKDYYNNMICKKLGAFHPLTIFLLTKLSEFTQSRGPIMILRDLLERNRNHEVAVVPAIYPTSIFDTDFSSEVLKMEQNGLMKSDNMSIYDQIINKPKYSIHLKAEDRAFIQAIVIINLLKLTPASKPDYYFLLENLTGLKENILSEVAEKLESNLGILQYDEEVFYHHIELNAVGKQDFRRFLIQKRNEIESENNYYEDLDFLTLRFNDVLKEQLSNFKTSLFRKITTLEWEFPQLIIEARSNICEELTKTINRSLQAITPDTNKGSMIWIYLNSNIITDTEKLLHNIMKISRELDIKKYPIQIGILLDTSSDLLSSIIDSDTLSNMSQEEMNKFSAFIDDAKYRVEGELVTNFKSVRSNAYYLNSEYDIIKTDKKFDKLFNTHLEEIYTKTIPFQFDGFTKQRNHNARSEYIQIVRAFASDDPSLSGFNNYLKPRSYNRMVGLLGKFSWNIFNDDKIVKPMHKNVSIVFEEIDTLLKSVSEEKSLSIIEIFEELLTAPYGMNIYSANLILTYVLLFYKAQFTFICNNRSYDFKNWLLIVNTDKIDLNIIRNTVITYCDPVKLKSATITYLNQILDAKSIDIVIDLSQKIDDIGDKYDFDDEVRTKVEQVKSKVFSACKIQESYNEIVRKCKIVEVNTNDEYDGIPDVLRMAFDISNEWNTLLTETRKSTMNFPDLWYEIYDNANTMAISFIKSNFEEWFGRNNWPKNHNVESYITFSKKLSKALYGFDFNEFGRMVKDNILKVCKSIEYLRECQARIADYQNRIIPNTYSECKEYNLGLKSFIDEISSSSLLTDKQKKFYFNQLKEIENKIKKKEEKLNQCLTDVYDILSDKDFTEISEIELFIKQLQNAVNSIDKNHSDYGIINETLENAQEIFIEVSKLEQGDYLEQEIVNKIKKIKSKFKDNVEKDPDFLTCAKLFDNVEKNLHKTLNKKIEHWMSMLPVGKINDLPETKLDQINSYISQPPTYLRDSELQVIAKLKKRIVDFQDKSVEDSIIRLFGSLANTRKKEEIINKLKKLLEG